MQVILTAGEKIEDPVWRSELAAFLDRARNVHGDLLEVDEQLGPLAVSFSAALLRGALSLGVPRREQARKQLSLLLENEQNSIFFTALTDRVHRSSSPIRCS